MSGLDARIEQLSPERRELLERLRRVRPAPPTSTAASAALDDSAERGSPRDYYDRVNLQLSASPFADDSLFLNYGYAPLDGAPPPRAYPESRINQHSIRLVLELLGNIVLSRHESALDVGCGRGGTASVLHRLFPVASLLGCDLSRRAIEFCVRRHREPTFGFLIADACRLPFADDSFALLTNVESSHSYPHLEGFLLEAARVLRPGGNFLYTDLLPTPRVAAIEHLLTRSGFAVELRRDITANVLLSCDQSAARKASAYTAANDTAVLQRFLATPDSEPYRAMREGALTYMLYRATKPTTGRDRDTPS